MKFAMSHDVSSPHNGAVFWSGGDLALAAVGQFNKQRLDEDKQPSTALEGTVGGKLMMDAAGGIAPDEKKGKPNGAPWGERYPAWRVISQRYARAASGEVNVIVADVPVGRGKILREEVKTLRANKKVTTINFLAIQKDDKGNPVKGADGNFVLVPVTAKDVLAKPPKEAKK